MSSDQILLIEDSEFEADLITSAFIAAKLSLQLEVVFGSEETINFLNLHASQPSLIFIDINPPIMNSINILKLLKQDNRFSHIPVITMSYLKENTVKQICYNNKTASYIHKSNNNQEFASCLRKVCDYWLDTVALPEQLLTF